MFAVAKEAHGATNSMDDVAIAPIVALLVQYQRSQRYLYYSYYQSYDPVSIFSSCWHNVFFPDSRGLLKLEEWAIGLRPPFIIEYVSSRFFRIGSFHRHNRTPGTIGNIVGENDDQPQQRRHPLIIIVPDGPRTTTITTSASRPARYQSWILLLSRRLARRTTPSN
jgi:hypothetical protein